MTDRKKSTRLNKIIPIVLLCTAILWVQACSLSKEVGLVSTGTAAGFSYFQSTLHAALQARCRNCHGDGGGQIGHSITSVSGAYTIARAKATTLAARSEDSHCGVATCDDGSGCIASCHSISSLVTAWRALEGL